MPGILGLVVLILDIWAIVKILNGRMKQDKKILWVLVVAFLPVLGFILWYLMGPKK